MAAAMSHIHLKTVPTLPPGAAAASFNQGDHTLMVGPPGVLPAGEHRAAIDTLTLSFTPGGHVFVGFDAFTNAEKWARRPLALPPVDRENALICLDPFDKNGLGPTGAGPVAYAYCRQTAILLLHIDGGPVAAHVRGLTGVVCALGPAGELRQLWVEGLKG
jgi:hypothetical protein